MTVRQFAHAVGEWLKAIILLLPLAVITLLIIAGVMIAKLFGVDFEAEDRR